VLDVGRDTVRAAAHRLVGDPRGTLSADDVVVELVIQSATQSA
jgi:hypothetical protein